MEFDLITRDEFNEALGLAKALTARVEQLEALLDEWVDTKTAMKITGVSRTTLEAERDRENTLIEFKYEGSKPVYSRKSLINYNESKKVGRSYSIARIQGSKLNNKAA